MDSRIIKKPFFKQFITVFDNEVGFIFKHFTHHWLLWVVPLAVFFLITSIFSSGVPLDQPMAYIDNDHSSLSRTVIRELNSGSHARLINYADDLEKAKSDIAKGKIYSVLIIPKNFESSLYSSHPVSPIIYYNAIYYSAGLYSTMDYSGLIAQLNAQIRPYYSAEFEVELPQLNRSTFHYDGLYNATGNSMYFQQFSAMIHLLQLFVITITIHLLGKLPRNTMVDYAFVIGKLAPYTFWYTGLLMFEIALLVVFSQARVAGNPFLMMLVIFFYVIAAQSVGVLLYSLTRNVIDAYSYIGLLVGLALVHSGIVIPKLSMPEISRVIYSIEPLTYALTSLFDLFLRQSNVLSVIKTCFILSIYPVIITLLIRKRLIKRIHSKERF